MLVTLNWLDKICPSSNLAVVLWIPILYSNFRLKIKKLLELCCEQTNQPTKTLSCIQGLVPVHSFACVLLGNLKNRVKNLFVLVVLRSAPSNRTCERSEYITTISVATVVIAKCQQKKLIYGWCDHVAVACQQEKNLWASR